MLKVRNKDMSIRLSSKQSSILLKLPQSADMLESRTSRSFHQVWNFTTKQPSFLYALSFMCVMLSLRNWARYLFIISITGDNTLEPYITASVRLHKVTGCFSLVTLVRIIKNFSNKSGNYFNTFNWFYSATSRF